MATDTTMNAGEEIDSRCLKCKNVTNHIIIAMKEEKIAKVQCNICGGRHNYRPAQPTQTKTKKKAASAKKVAAKAKTPLSVKKAAANYAKMVDGRNLGEALPYTMTSLFDKDDLVSHPTFGLGLVTMTIPPNKIELTFNEGPKILVCQLKSPDPLIPGRSVKAKKRKMPIKRLNPTV